ncbi:MAG: Ppx/GppA family phosphatase [Mariprofundales bacterium]|nr:Ppx/GppA family phosphatase [Mariprofundales bacterium]
MRAAIDLGSNTIRLLIVRPDSSRTPPWQVIHYHHHTARLGEGVRTNGMLGEAGMARALAALADLLARCHRFGVADKHIMATATAAVRHSDNGLQFCRQVASDVGITLRVLSGEEEAALSLRGSRCVLESEVAEQMLLFDIGGASTEFVRVLDGRMVDLISLPLGVIRLVEEGMQDDPPSAADWAAMRQLADGALATVEQRWQRSAASLQLPTNLVGTAGTVTTLAATEIGMAEYCADTINSHWMSRAAFNRLRQRLSALTNAQRQEIPSIEAGRSDLIVAGAAIVDAIFTRWSYKQLRCVDAGLMEGVLAEAIAG